LKKTLEGEQFQEEWDKTGRGIKRELKALHRRMRQTHADRQERAKGGKRGRLKSNTQNTKEEKRATERPKSEKDLTIHPRA